MSKEEAIVNTLQEKSLDEVRQILYKTLGTLGISIGDLVDINQVHEPSIGQYCKGCHHCEDIISNSVCNRCWSIKHNESELKPCKLCNKTYCINVCWTNTPMFYRKYRVCDICILYKSVYVCGKCGSKKSNGDYICIQNGAYCPSCVNRDLEYVRVDVRQGENIVKRVCK